MNPTYYTLSFKTKQNLPKKVHFKSKKFNLNPLNLIFNITLKNLRSIKAKKRTSSMKILKLLDFIIPDKYFGSKNNRKLFYVIVNIILTQSAFECLYLTAIIKGYNYDSIPWLKDVRSIQDCKFLLLKGNIFLLETIVKPLIIFCYKPLRTYVGQEIHFVKKSQWDSFQTRSLNRLKKSQFLVEVEPRSGVEPRGFFKIIPKGSLQDLNFRPIVNSFKTENKIFVRALSKSIILATRDMNKIFSNSLHDDWSKFLQKSRGREIYGAKLDVEDAYGNVNIGILTTAISSIQRKFLTDYQKEFVIKYIRNQFVIFRGKIYKWTHGLLQGDVLSASLCELYMTYIDKLYIGNTYCEDTFLHRTVDDYFFCSTEPHEVANFISYIKSIHRMNGNKTKTNIRNNGCDEIPYCGKVFNLKTKEVKNFYSFGKNYEIRHRFKLFNYHKPILEKDAIIFLRKAVTFSFCNNFFSKMELNTVYNSQKTVLENFFDGMIFVAYKFDATVMTLRNNYVSDDFNFVYSVLNECVKQYAVKVREIIYRYKGRNYKTTISFRLLKILAYKAFIAVFKRRSEIYKYLIEKIKKDNDLRVHFRNVDLNFEYFNKIPKSLRDVKISRKAVI